MPSYPKSPLDFAHPDLGLAPETGEMGQGLVEYAILATLISIAAVAIITLIGPILPGFFQGALNAL